MRVHAKYRRFEFPRDKHGVGEVFNLRDLVAARVEAVLETSTRPSVMCDVTFARDGRIVTVPFVQISGEMLDRRESSPFVWPVWLRGCTDSSTVDDLERGLLPWIEAQSFNQCLNGEVIRFFGSQGQRMTFERAREFGFIGAAPYRVVFQMCAPYVYAARFARAKRVHAIDSQAGSGAAMLAGVAEHVRADLRSLEANALAREWFDLDIFGESSGPADVHIGGSGGSGFHIDLSGVVGERVSVATPVPMDVDVSFDEEDAPPVRHFAVTTPIYKTPPVSLPQWVVKGGSSGRILIVVRDDGARAPDADTDAASLLAERLRAEGFTAEIQAASLASAAGYDLLHCFCGAFPEQALRVVREAKAQQIPVVLSEPPQLRQGDVFWATTVVPQIVRMVSDETNLQDYLRLLRARKLEGQGAVPGQEPFPAYGAAVAELRALADSVVPVDAAPLLPLKSPVTVPAGFPRDGFALVHAPLWPQSNQLMAVRAAEAAKVPVVLAGPIVDVEYARYVRAYGGDVVMLGEPALADVAALYAAAKVYLDVPWLRLGAGRIALAQAAGCAIVATPSVDPADEEGIAAALGRAWSAPRPSPLSPAADPLTAVVTAYSNCAAAGRNT